MKQEISQKAMEQAKEELAQDDFREQVEAAKRRIKENEGSFFSKIKKAFTTHKIVIRLERKKS